MKRCYPFPFLLFFGITQTVHTMVIPVDGINCSLAEAITSANSDNATGSCPAGSGADTLTLQADVTLAAALLTVGKMIRAGGTSHEMLLSSRNWVSWLPETDPLLAAFQVVLQPGMGLGMYHGALQIPGDYRGYVGYRLNDGRIVYNGLEPLGVGVR